MEGPGRAAVAAGWAAADCGAGKAAARCVSRAFLFLAGTCVMIGAGHLGPHSTHTWQHAPPLIVQMQGGALTWGGLGEEGWEGEGCISGSAGMQQGGQREERCQRAMLVNFGRCGLRARCSGV